MKTGSGRIALFVPSLRGGGAEKMMLHLARGISERGYAVDLVLSKAQGPYLTDVPNDVRVVDLRASRVAMSLPALVRYFRRERPRAFLSAMKYANVIALAAHRLSRVSTRVVVSEHTMPSSSVKHATKRRSRMLPALMRAVYPSADGIVAISHGVADDLAEVIGVPRERIRVIYNPAVVPEVFERAEAPLEHPWFAVGEPPVILGVGRLSYAKDFSTLIRAFALVRRDRPVRLIILGDGKERNTLEGLAKELGVADDVQMPGFAENPYAFMRRASVFVLSSIYEGLGNVLIEAMACGCKVVSTNCPSGPAEILEDGKHGPLVPVRDEESLASAIAMVLDQDLYRAGLTRRASDFSLDRAVEQFLEVLTA